MASDVEQRRELDQLQAQNEALRRRVEQLEQGLARVVKAVSAL